MFFASLQRNRKNPGASHFFGQAVAGRKALQSRKSGQRKFLRQHKAASRALALAFDQRIPTMYLQAFSATPDPTGNPRLRQRSQRIRSALASQQRMQVAAGSRHSGGFAHMKIGNREPPFP